MSERLKIGMAVAAFDPQVGGSEEVVKRLALGLKGLGHDVLVATAADPKRDPRRMVVPVIEFEVAGRSATGMTGNVAAYQQFLRSADRDVWLFYAAQVWSTDAALELFGSLDAAAVVVPCGYSALRDPRYRTYFEALPGYLSHADALVYMSRGYQDYEHDVARGLDALARVIPNGADDEEFAVRPDRSTGTHRKGGRVVLTVANHYRLKGHAAAIRAFRSVAGPDDRLRIVGETHSRSPRSSCWLRCRLSQRFDHRIELVRHASRAEVVAAYADADIFLLTSEVEAAPLVILEAMASALPFVTTPAGNVRDYSDCGFVAERDDVGGALGQLLEDGGLRDELGGKGRKRWEESHRWSTIVEAYESLFLEVVDARRRGTQATVP